LHFQIQLLALGRTSVSTCRRYYFIEKDLTVMRDMKYHHSLYEQIHLDSISHNKFALSCFQIKDFLHFKLIFKLDLEVDGCKLLLYYIDQLSHFKKIHEASTRFIFQA
jgi:hypothetical protein